MQIRQAHPHEADLLTDIAIKAKSHWGYDPDQIETWREFLTFTPEYVQANSVWVAVVEDEVAGVAGIEHTDDDGTVLEHLWVLPDYIGQGIGKHLFLHVAELEHEFEFTSDPNADNFYIKMGAVKIGEYESILQGRMLTKFRYTKTS